MVKTPAVWSSYGSTFGSRADSSNKPMPRRANAPAICAIEYGTNFTQENRRNTAKAKVTAGFKCAPEIFPAI